MYGFENFNDDLTDEAPRQVPLTAADMRHPIKDPGDAIRFILSGNATVTFQGKNSRFTFKVKLPRDRDTGKVDYNSQVLFVGVMTGADNENSFDRLGYIKRGVYFHGVRGSTIPADAPSAIAFRWAYGNLARGVMPAGLEVWHEGRCGRCGRTLTVPSSIANGIGPECIKHVH